MKNILTAIMFFGIILGFVLLAGSYAFNKQEVHECLTWQRQAEQIEEFYLNNWQQEQCQAQNITVK
jgi:hypothetical protein